METKKSRTKSKKRKKPDPRSMTVDQINNALRKIYRACGGLCHHETLDKAVKHAAKKAKEHEYTGTGAFWIMQYAMIKKYEKRIKAKIFILKAMQAQNWDFPPEYGDRDEAIKEFRRKLQQRKLQKVIR